MSVREGWHPGARSRSPQLLRPARVVLWCCALVGALIIWVSVSGCGGATALEKINSSGSGEVVAPALVPHTLREKTGLRIQLRPGPTPAGYDKAIYGTAINARGVKIQFAFFFAPNTHSEVPENLFRLIPHATDNGSSAGKSYIMISTAEYGHQQNVKLREEEFDMSSKMQWAVAALAPRAIREESP